jgi:hypothetical protein
VVFLHESARHSSHKVHDDYQHSSGVLKLGYGPFISIRGNKSPTVELC